MFWILSPQVYLDHPLGHLPCYLACHASLGCLVFSILLVFLSFFPCLSGFSSRTSSLLSCLPYCLRVSLSFHSVTYPLSMFKFSLCDFFLVSLCLPYFLRTCFIFHSVLFPFSMFWIQSSHVYLLLPQDLRPYCTATILRAPLIQVRIGFLFFVLVVLYPKCAALFGS